jgi:DNA-binding MarR family transcriptional regulator
MSTKKKTGKRAKSAIHASENRAGTRRFLAAQRTLARNDIMLGEISALAVADRLHSAAIHLLRPVRKQDISTGEGPARLSALSVLVFGGPKTLGVLAAAEQVKPPTMSRIVAGLKRSGLIVISNDPQDRRRMNIRATAKGTSLLQKGRELRISYLAQHLGALTPGELEILGEGVEILEKLLQNWR